MKPTRVVSLFCAFGAAVVLIGCGSKPHEQEHPSEAAQAARPVPTPDYTPIPDLRTPAGLVLGAERTQPPTEAPAPAPGLPQPTVAPQ